MIRTRPAYASRVSQADDERDTISPIARAEAPVTRGSTETRKRKSRAARMNDRRLLRDFAPRRGKLYRMGQVQPYRVCKNLRFLALLVGFDSLQLH